MMTVTASLVASSATVRLRSHLPPLDPLLQLADDDDTVQQLVAVDVDVSAWVSEDGIERLLAVEGIRERSTAGLVVYVPPWRRLYCLALDGEHVLVGDGDAERGEMAWAAVCHSGQIVAGLAEPQTPPDDAPLQ